MTTIPLKVLKRLRMGRDVAAEVKACYPGYRAWVHVKPLLAGELTNPDYGLEPRLRQATDDAIKGYEVRFILVHEQYLSRRYDLDKAWDDSLTADERFTVDNVDDLERVLTPRLSDFTSLHAPANVDYPALPRKPPWKQS